MNEGRPYLQMRRGVWVYFCKIAIVSFLSVIYKSDGLYCRMPGTPSSSTLFFIRVEIMIFVSLLHPHNPLTFVASTNFLSCMHTPSSPPLPQHSIHHAHSFFCRSPTVSATPFRHTPSINLSSDVCLPHK